MQQQRSDSPASWILRCPDDIAWACWDDEYVAYHRLSGKTHFLNASSHFVLTELLREPLTTEHIASIFLPENSNDDGMDGDTYHEILTMLEHFEQLGLIERA